jgi:hypothetical protein
VVVNRNEQGNRIDAVPDTAESQSPFHANLVDKGSTEEAEDGESAVESGILFRRQLELGVLKSSG